MASTMVSASSGAMNSLLGKLAALMGEEYGKIKGVQKEVKSLEEEFSSMKALLDKLEDMYELDAPAKEWRNQVKDMSYDIEDCIDEFMHRIGNNNDATTGLMKKTARLLKKLRARHQLATKILEIKARVKEVDERRKRYNLDSCSLKSTIVHVDPRVVTMHMEAGNLVGIDVPREELVKLLMDEEHGFKVASIVGFGGLGKTTLANQVYHKLEGQFQCKAFVSVSQRPDIPKLLNKILHEICGNYSHTGDLDDLIEKIKEHLQDKRYFIVIDDLWDSSAWKIIRCAFPENNRGSRVLTTTRIYGVALSCCSDITHFIYNMKPLCEEDSRRLFSTRIFGSSLACSGASEEDTADILRKCGGLPLAIISIASLLAGQSKSKWEYVRNSLGSMFEGNPTLEDMMGILDLSYINLPHRLKSCLLYLGMYPEDHIIKKDDLLRQWIAEGFVSNVRGLDAEDIAGSYFNELINRSMIQPVQTDYNDEVLSCRVHDIMLDLIRAKSAQENFIDVIYGSQGTVSLHNKARRISIHDQVARGWIATTVNRSLSHVRSLVSFAHNFRPPLEGLKYVRVLQLQASSCPTEKRKLDLTGICGLFLLRYLKIEAPDRHAELPSQLWALQCLETMDLCVQMDMVTIPSDACLPRLSHLIVQGYTVFQGGIGSLKSLRTLKGFDILRSSLESVKSLAELTNLRDLQLYCNEYYHVPDTAMDAALRSSVETLMHYSNSNLKRLIIYGTGVQRLQRFGCFYTLSGLSCNLGIGRLHLGIQLPRIPKWIAQLNSLYRLNLNVDKVVANDGDDDIGSILGGLPSLVYLRLEISGDQEERIAIANTASSVAFPALKCLTFVCREPLLFFRSAGALPSLQDVTLFFKAPWEDLGKWMEPVAGGIEHLPAALKHIHIQCINGHFNRAIESAMRNAFTMRYPDVELSLYGLLFSKDDHNEAPFG